MYVCPVFFQVYPMHNALFMYIKKTLKKFIPTFAEKRLYFILKPDWTQTVMCSIFSVEYNVGPVQCSVDPVESSIDVDHMKFSWVWLCQPFLTPMVENEVLAEVGNKVWTEAKWGIGRD